MVTCTGHIGIHEEADRRTDGHIDGLPYFLNYGAPCTQLRNARSSANTILELP